jgi:hypothetical protein
MVESLRALASNSKTRSFSYGNPNRPDKEKNGFRHPEIF